MKKKILQLVGGNALSTIILGLLGIYVARVLGPAGRGEVAILTGTVLLFSSILNFGISHSSAYFIRSKPGAASKILKFINNNLLLSVLITGIFLLTTGNSFSQLFLNEGQISILLAILILIFVANTTSNTNLGACLIAMGKAKGYGIALNIGSTLSFLTTVIGFQFFGATVEITICGTVLGQSVTNTLFRILFRRESKNKVAENLPTREFLNYGLKAYLGSISSLVFKRIDLYLIGLYLNISTVGIYAVGLSLRDLALIIPRAISGLLGGEVASKLNEYGMKQRIQLLRKALLNNFLLTSIILAGSFFLFPYFIPLMYGKAYTESVFLSLIIMGSLIPFSSSVIVGGFINGLGKPIYLSLGNLISSVLTIGTMIYLIRTFGIYGAAWNTVIGAILLLAFSWIAYLKVNKSSMIIN